VGGTLLTTHHVEGDRASKHRVTTRGSGGVALVFHVTDIHSTVAELARRGVKLTEGPGTSEIGTIAQFEDPAGHIYQLFEPREEALSQPVGSMLERILSARLRKVDCDYVSA